MRNQPFSVRILLIAFVPASLVAVLMSLYFIVQSGRDSEDAEMLRAQTLAQGLSRAAEFGVATRNTVILEQAAQAVLAVPSVYAVRFYDVADQLVLQLNNERHQFGKISPVARRARGLFSEWPLIGEVSAVIKRTDLTLYEDPLFDTLDTVEVTEGKETVGRIELGVDLSLAYENQYEIIQQVLIYVSVVLLLALAAAYRLARSIISPVRSLTDSVRSLARNEYVQVMPSGAAGELDELAQGINFLSRELKSLHARQSEAIRLATVDLQNTLSLLESKNTELESEKRRAEKASAFKSQFVANVSHEIRTPLNAIIGTLSVMNKSGLDITQVDQIDMIQGSANTLLDLIEDILDISKIESGNLMVESISTNIEALLADLHDLAALQAIKGGIELFVSPIPDPALREAFTDSLRLKQVLSNLLSNAIKFTPSGHVALFTSIVQSEPGSRLVRFSVEDTGIGIPKEQQSTLFSAFTQADMSTTRRYGGTGLGLFICHGIVQLLGGSIRLDSQPGKGTRVHVEVPFKVAGTTVTELSIRDGMTDLPAADTLRYIDAYQPLEDVNRHLLSTAFASIAHPSMGYPTDTVSKIPICVTHIPNRVLIESWKDPADLNVAVANSRMLEGDAHLAWVSAITPQLNARLKQLGYLGYIVRTPSLIQLKRQIQVAISGQCFGTTSVRQELDDRQERLEASLTVLAVDDQRINIDLLMQYFDHLAIRGLYALSGDEAMAFVATETIDLVLLDLHMPDQDGFEVVDRIRSSDGSNAQIPVIAMTADAYPATREKALASGFDDLLTKPATVNQVKSMINTWLDRDESYDHELDGDTHPTTVVESLRVDMDGAQKTEIIDLAACVDAMHGREEWVINALKTYASEIPDHLNDLHRALEEKDLGKLHQSAHAIKGVSRLFQIHTVADAAEALERGSSTLDWQGIARTMNELEQLLRRAEMECLAIDE